MDDDIRLILELLLRNIDKLNWKNKKNYCNYVKFSYLKFLFIIELECHGSMDLYKLKIRHHCHIVYDKMWASTELNDDELNLIKNLYKYMIYDKKKIRKVLIKLLNNSGK